MRPQKQDTKFTIKTNTPQKQMINDKQAVALNKQTQINTQTKTISNQYQTNNQIRGKSPQANRNNQKLTQKPVTNMPRRPNINNNIKEIKPQQKNQNLIQQTKNIVQENVKTKNIEFGNDQTKHIEQENFNEEVQLKVEEIKKQDFCQQTDYNKSEQQQFLQMINQQILNSPEYEKLQDQCRELRKQRISDVMRIDCNNEEIDKLRELHRKTDDEVTTLESKLNLIELELRQKRRATRNQQQDLQLNELRSLVTTIQFLQNQGSMMLTPFGLLVRGDSRDFN